MKRYTISAAHPMGGDIEEFISVLSEEERNSWQDYLEESGWVVYVDEIL